MIENAIGFAIMALTAATRGVSRFRLSDICHELKNEEIMWLIENLPNNGLVEYGKSSNLFWITVDGIKFLELDNRMDRMLREEKFLT